jgi:HD-GYP domain-containing protein (c-di-GMP phosphodiesterase class II)
MLKKIPVQKLRQGMHIHEVCGSWLDHPFWKSAFKLTESKDLAQLQGSGVREVVIDTRKGLDVAPEVTVSPEPPPVESEEPPAPVAEPDAPVYEPTAFADELNRASIIMDQALPAMKSMFEDARMGKALDAEHCLPVVHEITQSVSRNPEAFVSLARLKTSDDYTYMHSVAVCALMVALARQLGLSEDDTREAGLAGLVHDLGKALMPPEVLNKPGKLTVAEYDIMKGHPAAGHGMLLEGQGVGPIPLDVCLHHHERMDGKGYPHGLPADQISLFARMGAVCDVYDAITSNRPYKAGWDPAESVQKMAQWAKDGQFDERIFQAFVKSIGIYPTGSLVKLRSGRLGVVVEQGVGSLLTPMVKVFYSTSAMVPLAPEMLDLSAPACGDQIVSRESAATWGVKNIDQLWRAQP